MKYVRLSLAAGIMTAVLSASAFAGDMPLPGFQPPPPPPSTRSQPTEKGDMPTGGMTFSTASEVTLALINGVLSLL